MEYRPFRVRINNIRHSQEQFSIILCIFQSKVGSIKEQFHCNGRDRSEEPISVLSTIRQELFNVCLKIATRLDRMSFEWSHTNYWAFRNNWR